MARGAAMLSREGVIRACLAKYLFKNVFQNSIDFTQPEHKILQIEIIISTCAGELG